MMSYFSTKQLDIALIGLAGSGKTAFARSMSLPAAERATPGPETIPTIGLEIQIFQQSGVQVKLFDLGGQSAYRSEWPRYVQGSDVIVLVIDTQHPFDLLIVKKELHGLLENVQLSKIPILVLANKIDLGSKLKDDQEIVEGLNLDYLTDNPWEIIQCSAKTGVGVDKALEYLLKHAK